MTPEEIKIERLYKLLDWLTRENKADMAASLRWAIFQIENR